MSPLCVSLMLAGLGLALLFLRLLLLRYCSHSALLLIGLEHLAQERLYAGRCYIRSPRCCGGEEEKSHGQ